MTRQEALFTLSRDVYRMDEALRKMHYLAEDIAEFLPYTTPQRDPEIDRMVVKFLIVRDLIEQLHEMATGFRDEMRRPIEDALLDRRPEAQEADQGARRERSGAKGRARRPEGAPQRHRRRYGDETTQGQCNGN